MYSMIIARVAQSWPRASGHRAPGVWGVGDHNPRPDHGMMAQPRQPAESVSWPKAGGGGVLATSARGSPPIARRWPRAAVSHCPDGWPRRAAVDPWHDRRRTPRNHGYLGVELLAAIATKAASDGSGGGGGPGANSSTAIGVVAVASNCATVGVGGWFHSRAASHRRPATRGAAAEYCHGPVG